MFTNAQTSGRKNQSRDQSDPTMLNLKGGVRFESAFSTFPYRSPSSLHVQRLEHFQTNEKLPIPVTLQLDFVEIKQAKYLPKKIATVIFSHLEP